MILRGHIVRAEGSPSATLVVPRDELHGSAVLLALAAAMREGPCAEVTKVAIVGTSSRHDFDITYQFVQVLPGPVPGIELRGSCGHSILAACAVARHEGWVPDGTVAVDVLNNGDTVRCTPLGGTDGDQENWTMRFHREPATPIEQLQLLGEPTTSLLVDGRMLAVSAISAGNPYLFVSADQVGVRDVNDLFSRDTDLFDALTRIHVAGAQILGWPEKGAFPKVAALLPLEAGEIAARAVSVPRWHPSLALTGLVCLAAATAVEGSLPALITAETDSSELSVRTPGGLRAVTSDREPGTGALRSVAVRNTVVRHLGQVVLTLSETSQAVRPGARRNIATSTNLRAHR